MRWTTGWIIALLVLAGVSGFCAIASAIVLQVINRRPSSEPAFKVTRPAPRKAKRDKHFFWENEPAVEVTRQAPPRGTANRSSDWLLPDAPYVRLLQAAKPRLIESPGRADGHDVDMAICPCCHLLVTDRRVDDQIVRCADQSCTRHGSYMHAVPCAKRIGCSSHAVFV